jgi:hypothetical protein
MAKYKTKLNADNAPTIKIILLNIKNLNMLIYTH